MIVLITGLSPGSVVVTFSLVFVPDSTQNISSIAYKLMESLKSSTQFTVDPNSTKITGIFTLTETLDAFKVPNRILARA